MFLHNGHEFNEALVRSRIGKGFPKRPSALLHNGYEFNEARVRSRTEATFSMRP